MKPTHEELVAHAKMNAMNGESLCPSEELDLIAGFETKCAALAAENAALKSATEFATAPDMWEDMGGNVMRYQYKEWYADKLKSAMETPATDAILAEVRAQGVEMFAQALRGEAEITKACTFKPVQKFEEFAARADECAAKLRQDANTAELVAAGIITKVGE